MNISYLGNKSLLDLPKTAFLASSTIPVDKVLPCYDWVVKMRDGNRCVVSGFSSKLEKDVLNFLLKGKQPIILVLARQMYKHVPQDLQPLLDDGRLLIISTTSATRQSKTTSLARNRYICEIANRILFVAAYQQSSLATLEQTYKHKSIKL